MGWQAHWQGRERYVIFATSWCEADFNSWRADWREDPERPRHLHVIALAPHPLAGWRRLLQDEAAITLDLLHTTLPLALAQLQARIDAVQLSDDAADPELLRPLSRLLNRDAVLQGAPMSAVLAATGWIDDGAGVLRYATRKPIPAPPPAPRRTALVIGAGLAGVAACERLCARGWQVSLLERHPAAAMEASGNLAGISMPLLSKDDNQASRLSRAAFLFARDYWQRLGGVGAQGTIEGAQCGVLLAARDPADAALQRAIASARAMPPEYAEWFEAAAASKRFGAVAPHGAWFFQEAGWIRPASAIAAMLNACGPGLTRHLNTGDITLAQNGDGWQAIDGSGNRIASAAIVIVASGAGAIAQTAALPLVRVRGQVTHLAGEAVPELGFVLCREAYITPMAGGIRSAGATYDNDFDPQLRQSSQDDNLANMRSMLADDSLAIDAPLAGRVGFRAVAPDRLPMVGAVPEPEFALGAERLRDLPRQPGLYALLGYASRGLTWAPLAAELLAAQLESEPLPLPADLTAALDPARFLLRARRGKQRPVR
jgi:tRNA 5-methylaminomethyl-2-thiouridine biosynthesis bifunctional protein